MEEDQVIDDVMYDTWTGYEIGRPYSYQTQWTSQQTYSGLPQAGRIQNQTALQAWAYWSSILVENKSDTDVSAIAYNSSGGNVTPTPSAGTSDDCDFHHVEIWVWNEDHYEKIFDDWVRLCIY